MAVDINGFRAAAARLFFDMINADGIIEDNEMLLLEGFPNGIVPKDEKGNPIDLPDLSRDANKLVRAGGLRHKYGIELNHIRKASELSTSMAINILIDWQHKGEKTELKYNPTSVFTIRNVIADLDVVSRCDGNCDPSEAKLLVAISLCLNEGIPEGQRAIPIPYRERTLRFAQKEIVYLESEYNEKINKDITNNKTFIESLLSIYGYDFIYIPSVVEFLKKKASDKLLEPILRFTHPFYYQDEKRTADFAKDIQNITTEDFTQTFCRAANLDENLPPCLLVKVKTSTTETRDANDEIEHIKYIDFIALPIHGSVVDSVRRLPDNILAHTDSITSLVKKNRDEKLYCRGIHKTLISYAVNKSSSNIVRKIVITLMGKSKSIKFEGIDGGIANTKPTEVVLYLLAIIYTIKGKGICKRNSESIECNEIKKTFSILYNNASDNSGNLYTSLSTTKTGLKKKINRLEKLIDKEKYNLDDKGEYIKVNVNPDIVYIHDIISNSDIPLCKWLDDNNIKI